MIDPIRDRIEHVARILDALYPDPRCALDFENPWQLLVATVLSAQARDERVNAVTPVLFARFPDAAAAAVAEPADLVPFIRTLGLFNHKARNLVALARILVERHGGDVPRSLDALVELPGVARKTAHVVLQNAWGLTEGFVVDTHVARLSVRLDLVPPAFEGRTGKIERALCAVFPQTEWSRRSHQLILHGRAVCDARRPQCGACPLATVCPAATP
jgi:endonuclease-3